MTQRPLLNLTRMILRFFLHSRNFKTFLPSGGLFR